MPGILKNKYFIVTIVFVVWVGFLDPNNFIQTLRLRQEIKELKANKLYYLREIEKTKRLKEELVTNKELIEKFARENYYFTRPGEELYLIDEKDYEEELEPDSLLINQPY